MKNLIIVICCTAFMISGCAISYLKNSSNVSGAKKSYDKILVVAKAKDKLSRIKFEDQVVADFALQGIKAFSSMEVIRTENFDKEVTEKDLEQMRLKLVEDGYDGVIITNLVNVNNYTDVVSGGTNTAIVGTRYGRFGRYYRSYPVTYWEPDQVQTGVEYTLESCLYDITINPEDNLQWVGRFQVKDPSSLVKAIEKYSKELTEALVLESIAQ